MQDQETPTDVPQPSHAVRAAEAAELMAVALRLGVGLPSGVEQQSAIALDAVANNLRDGDGTDPPEAVDALASIVPAPARGIMRLAAAGADVRQLLGFLERMAALDRRRRWDSRMAISYPVGICLCAAIGIGVLAFVQDPSLNSLAEPIQMAMPEPEVAPTPVFDAVAWPVGIAAVVVAAVLAMWRATRQRQFEMSRRWAAVACELDAISSACQLSGEKRESILLDLQPVTGVATARPLPPLARFAQQHPSGPQSAGLRELASFYHETTDAVSQRRVRLLPVIGAMIAGVAVLLYGIALFVPLTRLFESMASMPVAPPWSPGS